MSKDGIYNKLNKNGGKNGHKNWNKRKN